jgi:ferric-dicitrate binding protein FerR (iron transport regulator)
VRQLWAQTKGRFRTKGRFASATVRGTKWQTEDLCLATRITVAEGIVAVLDYRRKKTTVVRAGNSLTISALRSARYRHRPGVHGPRLSQTKRR